MPGVTRSTYIKLSKRPTSLTKKYMKAFEDGGRPIYKAYAQQWADGYNRIVKNWSEESRPKFVGRAEFQKRTGRWFVRVQIVGTSVQKARFEGLDFGAPRGQKAATPDITGRKMASARGYRLIERAPSGGYADKDKFIISYNVEHGTKPGSKESLDAYAKYVRDTKEKLTSYYKGKEQATKQQYLYATRRAMMPMFKYASKTGRGGRIGGVGSREFSNIVGWKHEIKLGAIDARWWTVGLKYLTESSRDIYGVRNIWPGLVQWRTVCQNAFDAGKVLAKASK